MTCKGFPLGPDWRYEDETRKFSSKRWSIDDFERGSLLGKGRFGTVVFARERATNLPVALKIMNRQKLVDERMEHQVKREILIHSRMDHKNIIDLYGFFHDDYNLYLVLEHAPGKELYERLQEKTPALLCEAQAAQYIRQVALALAHCHKHNVIHRDLKPENLLIGDDGELKLADFGWAVISSEDADRRKTLCGTMDYLPPEMLSRIGHTAKADIWCLGVLCYELLYANTPFYDESSTGTTARISSVDLKFPAEPPVSAAAKDLIRSCLAKDPEDRLTIPGVLRHRWIKQHTRLQGEKLRRRARRHGQAR